MKSAEITRTLDTLSHEAFGRTRSECIRLSVCTTCGKPADEFKDTLSEKEFGISGMCQVCQDKIFG